MRLDVYQLADKLDVQPGTLRAWLSNYRFNKDRLSCKPMSFNVTNDFLTCLEGYLGLKKQNTKIKQTMNRISYMRWGLHE